MKTNNLKIIAISVILLSALRLPISAYSTIQNSESLMSKDILFDKIKGAWAGQTIGVSYGAPTEFHYQGRMIPDSVVIEWGGEDCIKKWMDRFPGLYDDVYMDLTFVEVFDRLGLDAPVDSMAMAFANAGYMLWKLTRRRDIMC